MKRIALSLALCLMAGSAGSRGAQAAMDTEELSEKILSFSTQGDKVKVICELSAQPLRLSAERQDFARQMGNLAAAWKAKKPVKLVIKNGEIVSIAAP